MVKINSLVEFYVEQIKVSGVMYVGGKRVDAGVNKTLDASIVSQLPIELVQMLTLQAFGNDYTSDELFTMSEQLSALADVKKESEQTGGND